MPLGAEKFSFGIHCTMSLSGEHEFRTLLGGEIDKPGEHDVPEVLAPRELRMTSPNGAVFKRHHLGYGLNPDGSMWFQISFRSEGRPTLSAIGNMLEMKGFADLPPVAFIVDPNWTSPELLQQLSSEQKD